jgi:REP element-mobilizing transposase RayT
MNDRSSFRHNPKEDKPLGKSGGAGVPPAVFLPLGGSLKVRSRRLPHWEVEEAVYFVTFRLGDSLPRKALQELDTERQDILATASKMGRSLTETERGRIVQLQFRKLEKILDTGEGKCFLRDTAIARVVVNALQEFDGSRYRLFAWSVMPNHVHVLAQTIGKISLAGILHSWKSYSSKAANQILGRTGEFWQREYYDHLIRNDAEFDRAARYVMENPSKAGLENWSWVWCWK